MARMQPSLIKAESDLVDQIASLTRIKRTDVIKNALAVYRWFVRQAVTGARITATTPTGEEVSFQAPEFSVLEATGHKLGPRALATLASQMTKTSDPLEAARLKERLTRGFYGI